MAVEKRKTGNRVRARVVVKRDQSSVEDVQEKPDILPKTNEKGSDGTLHSDTGSLVVSVDATKTTSKAVEGVVSEVEGIFRSIAKELIKGGIVLADNVSELASETGEKFKGLLAEAKSEVEKTENRGQQTNKTKGKDGS